MGGRERWRPREGPITRLDPIQCELLYPRSPSTPIPGMEICNRLGAALHAGVHMRTTVYGELSARGFELDREGEKARSLFSSANAHRRTKTCYKS